MRSWGAVFRNEIGREVSSLCHVQVDRRSIVYVRAPTAKRDRQHGEVSKHKTGEMQSSQLHWDKQRKTQGAEGEASRGAAKEL